MVKRTFRRRKSGKRRAIKKTRRTRRVRRSHGRRRTIKGGGVNVSTLERLYPDVPRIIESIKNNPRYAEALNNSDGSDEDNFRIIYNVLTQHTLENRQLRIRRPDLVVSWSDSDGIPKSSTFYLDRSNLDISMPNKAQNRLTIYTPDDAPQQQQQVMMV